MSRQRSKTIRSHRARVKQANETLKYDPKLSKERISIVDREALVEFYLLEDIEELYKGRLKDEMAYVPQGRADEKAHKSNIEKFSAIIDIFDAAIGAARAAIKSGEYKRVWKAIHEGPLMAAASNIKNLPELKALAIDLLRELSADALRAVDTGAELDKALDELCRHEENVRQVKDLPPSMDEIEDIIRVADEAIPDGTRSDKQDRNT